MNYKETLDFLFSSLPMYQRTGAAAYKNSLDTTIALDKAHNFPHREFKSIHIAGTNGKGSVSHMLAAILQSAGLKTGLYTSPHMTDFRERIRINGKMIPEQEVVNYVRENKSLIEALEPSFFEMTADLAFLYFAREKVDIAVIETGMGGRLDSTNIIHPLLSIITNIGMDHMRFLGNTLKEIATEKGGIIKKGVPIVIGETDKETASVFQEISTIRSSRISFADQIFTHHHSLITSDRKISHNISSSDTEYHTLISDLKGIYQKKNIITVLAAIIELKLSGIDIPRQAVYDGIRETVSLTGLRGRWEEIGYNPLTICDSGHNEDGIKQVVEQITNTAYKQLHFVLGVVSDKDISTILKLLPKEAIYYFTKASIPRAMNEFELMKSAQEIGLTGSSYPTVSEAFKCAQKNAGPQDLIFVGGSSFVVSEVIEFIDHGRI
ncbi:MAG: bifunctional folylpolyglutamate synthase/dihydrofolate synthase [Bacteroidales bacterium]|nr:bifunctional folylpolyglutamate synthase/dihydrofolate synthase [Bacteroidales bacterium]MCF8391931.1 bifunctional folylpolyglutamate synthase/dihydrofolate synthase [Bacteroidales bacterium]